MGDLSSYNLNIIITRANGQQKAIEAGAAGTSIGGAIDFALKVNEITDEDWVDVSISVAKPKAERPKLEVVK